MASHWFRISFADKAFLRLVAARGLTLDSLSAPNAWPRCSTSTPNDRAQHTDLAAGGDTLTLTVRRSRSELARTMTRSDDALQTRTLVLVFDTDSGRKPQVVTCSTPEQATLLLAHLREELLVEAGVPGHLRVERRAEQVALLDRDDPAIRSDASVRHSSRDGLDDRARG